MSLAPAIQCVADGFGCDAPSLVDAVCDAPTHTWQCPSGARPYARAPDNGSVCLPFAHATGLTPIKGWGLSGLTRIPTDDGRCLWIVESMSLTDGTPERNVALEVDRHAPFGTCPESTVSAPFVAVTMEGGDDPSIYAQIDGGYRLGGATHVLYRLFKVDPTATFGVTEMGGGVARWDATSGRIVIPSPSTPFRWGKDLDLGDAMLPAGDGTHAYVWGCSGGNGFLVQDCRLARLDAARRRRGSTAPGGRSSPASGRATGQWRSCRGAGARRSWPSRRGSGTCTSATSETGSRRRRRAARSGPGPMRPTSAGAISRPTGAPSARVRSCTPSWPTRRAPGELPITYAVGVAPDQMSGPPEEYGPRMVWKQ